MSIDRDKYKRYSLDSLRRAKRYLDYSIEWYWEIGKCNTASEQSAKYKLRTYNYILEIISYLIVLL